MTYQCELCKASLGDREWILLNRYAIGFRTGHSLTESRNGLEEYAWHVAEDEDDVDAASGPVLCWPHCATSWIEAKMAAGRATMRMRGGS